MTETLGAVAHRGGLLVQRPELTVGIVQAVSRTSGLDVELIARRPLDRRSATERQHDIRSQRGGHSTAAPRLLLPAFDEGANLRLGWLDHTGRAHWEFATTATSSSGDHFNGTVGPNWRTTFTLPPAFSQVSLVLAWPEIGFPETVIPMPLPERTAVEQATMSIWQAPLDTLPETGPLDHRVGTRHNAQLALETGTIVATPRVLHRSALAAVVLTRLTAIGSALSMELRSIAKDRPADAVTEQAFPRKHPPSSTLADPAQIRANGPAASLAVIQGCDAAWISSHAGSSTGGRGSFTGVQEFTLHRPDDNILELLVAWPLAGLHDVRVQVTLDQPL